MALMFLVCILTNIKFCKKILSITLWRKCCRGNYKALQQSPASPIVLVRKKGGSRCLYIDYKRLNQNTIKDRFPISLIEYLMDELCGATIFSIIGPLSRLSPSLYAKKVKSKIHISRHICLSFWIFGDVVWAHSHEDNFPGSHESHILPMSSKIQL